MIDSSDVTSESALQDSGAKTGKRQILTLGTKYLICNCRRNGKGLLLYVVPLDNFQDYWCHFAPKCRY
jgi:hypothetical protein